MFSRVPLTHTFNSHNIRYFSLSARCHARKVCVLKERAALRVKGPESMDFLQGLMTNDMNHLDNQGSIYSMFLNTQGRIMFDTFIVKKTESDFLIDCDQELAGKLVKHLKMYKVRRKIDIQIQDSDKVFAIFDDQEEPSDEEQATPNALYYKDIRCSRLGLRCIANSMDTNCETTEYLKLRYSLGIPEGGKEIPLGKCTPLEYNVEYMHGVSFHKGCYIGQELTARTHHTGVIRKRIMPVLLSKPLSEMNPDVLNEKGKKVGTIRGSYDNVAIGLMRLQETLNSANLIVCDEPVKIELPNWWPKSAPKNPQNRS